MNRGRRSNMNNYNHENVENMNNAPKMPRLQNSTPSTPQRTPQHKMGPKSILKNNPKPQTPAVQQKELVADDMPVQAPPIIAPKQVEVTKEMEVNNVPEKEPEPVTEPEVEPEAEPVENSSESVEMSEESSSPRKPFFKKIFGGVRKKPSIRAKERKIRQNRHLRKVILPKNALMALYEIKGIQIGDFIINTNMEGGFTALVTVNGCQYEATGNSKSNAKTNACEKALRDYIIKKMMQKPRAQSLSEPMDTGESNDVPNGEDNATTAEESDDVPMVNLASFALYKLYTAWENEGFHVPEFHTSAPSSNSTSQSVSENATKKSVGRNELPVNWELMHPATLLCIMRPRLSYTDCGNSGDIANPIQTVKVVVDDQEFTGTGRSKKIARKNVAISVCNTLFNTNFGAMDE